MPVRHPLRALDRGLTDGCFGNSSILGGHSSKADSYHFDMMQSNEEFEVETDRAGQAPLSLWSETVRRVAVE